MPIFKSEDDRNMIVLCECNGPQHMLFVRFFDDPKKEFSMFSLEVHLVAWHSLWRRWWEALKYVFGFKHSCWGDMLIDIPTATTLRDYLGKYIDKVNEA